MRNQFKLFCSAVLVTAVMMSGSVRAGTISLNFSQNTNQAFAGNTPIGPLQTNSSYWNNTIVRDSGELKAGIKSGLIDGLGNNTGASVQWLSGGVYYNRKDNTSNDENKLEVGYLDDGVTSTDVGVDVTFTDIPYTYYRVYGLISSDFNRDSTAPDPDYSVTMRNVLVNGSWVYGGDASTTAIAYGSLVRNFAANGTNWTEIVPGITVGNYWTIKTNGSTLSIKGLPILQWTEGGVTYKNRGSLAGVIIEELDIYRDDVSPTVGAEVPVNQILNWKQREEVSGLGITYRVYFGTEPNTLNPNYYGKTPVKTTLSDPADFYYDPAGDMLNSTKYYWRVDAVEPNLAGQPIVYTGAQWWFTTQPALARIETSPISQTVLAGTAEVQLSVSGINIAHYQWYKDGVALPNAPAMYSGQNSAVLTIYDVQLADEGFYYCVGDNSLKQPSTSASAQVMIESFVCWWKLDGNLADSVAEAVPGSSGHDGTSTEPNFVAVGKDGGVLEFFGGADDVVTITDSADTFNFYPLGYTVSVWVKNTQPSGWCAYVAKQQRTETPWKGFVISQSSGRPVHALRQTDSSDLYAPADKLVSDDTWHLVTATYDAATRQRKIYIDGELKNQRTDTGLVEVCANNLIFGAEMQDASVSPYHGLLDDIRIWNFALDRLAVAKMYIDFNPTSKICLENPMYDISGPDGVADCIVNLYDVLPIMQGWLNCNLVPDCIE
ncbi:MAG: LamG-like jellyroll fold domain-containing protein [Anaerohalosphaeraceae bacterium]